tara:strand:- start:1229 stop:2122 length:894 start_codon:yes stop_codon:yes gene_type:complete
MVIFECPRCKKIYTHKGHYKRHLNRKFDCRNKDTTDGGSKINNNDKEVNIKMKKKVINPHKSIKKEFICHLCERTFSRKDNLRRHINKYCKIKKERDEKDKIYQQLLVERKEMEFRINKLEKSNVNFYQQFNTINQININSFGNEKLENLSKKEIIEILNKCYKALPELVKKIHIDLPENRNVYIPNKKEPYAMIYDNDRWFLKNTTEVINELIEINNHRLVEFLEVYKEQINQVKIDRIQTMIQNSQDGVLDQQYEAELKVLLINYADLIQEYYQKNMLTDTNDFANNILSVKDVE